MKTESAAVEVLALRPWRVEDAPALREAIDESLDSLKRWMSWAHEEPSTPGALGARLRGYAEDFAAGRRWRYAVWLGEAGPLAGGASLHPRVGPGGLELSYWVRSGLRRQGIAGAAAAALVRHAFLARRVGRVEVCVDEGNEASAALAVSLGFGFRGRLTREHWDGRPRPMLAYRLDSLNALRAPAGWRVEVEGG
ncbi:MAG TPA: GNAT family N-acetyltransferase [Pyrinomonadaceae bacterium]|jgi:RimJ/RimL family protein N-acetyltransferase